MATDERGGAQRGAHVTILGLLFVVYLLFAAEILSQPASKYLDLRAAIAIAAATPLVAYALVTSLALYALRRRRRALFLAHGVGMLVVGLTALALYILSRPPGLPPHFAAMRAQRVLSERLGACIKVEPVRAAVTDAGEVTGALAAVTNLCPADLVLGGLAATLHHHTREFAFVADPESRVLPRGELVTIPLRGAHRLAFPRSVRWSWRVELSLASPPIDLCFASPELVTRCARLSPGEGDDTPAAAQRSQP